MQRQIRLTKKRIKMKKILLVICLIAVGSARTLAQAQESLDLLVGVNFVDPTPAGNGPNRTTPIGPSVSQDGHTLFFNNLGYDLTLVIEDEYENEVYTVFVPAGTTNIVLPSYLSGSYELKLYPEGYYYFYCDIEL